MFDKNVRQMFDEIDQHWTVLCWTVICEWVFFLQMDHPHHRTVFKRPPIRSSWTGRTPTRIPPVFWAGTNERVAFLNSIWTFPEKLWELEKLENFLHLSWTELNKSKTEFVRLTSFWCRHNAKDTRTPKLHSDSKSVA